MLKSFFVTAAAAAVLWMSAAPAAAQDYALDPGHSAVVFRISHLGLSHTWGRFNEVSGTLNLTDPNPGVSVKINANSVDTGVAKRDEHLRGPDFFSVKQFPEISFVSKTIKAIDDKTYEVSGDLTLHGVVKPIVVKIQKLGEGKTPFGDVRLGVEAVFQIKRSEFGMKHMLEGIGDDVMLVVSLEGVRK